jgi:hypothetical protein
VDYAAQPGSSTAPGCLVLGSPGTGKTALLLELEQRQSSPLKNKLLATYYCQAHDTRSLTQSAFIRSVLRQLRNRLPQFRELVDSQSPLREAVRTVLSGDEEKSTVGVFLDALAVLKALPKAPSEGHVLMIDSLDEALLIPDAVTTKNNTIVDVLFTCSSKGLFPRWLKVLATSRDGQEIQSLFSSWKRILLDDKERKEENRQAMRDYINLRLGAADSTLKQRVSEMTPVLAPELEPELEPPPEPEPQPRNGDGDVEVGMTPNWLQKKRVRCRNPALAAPDHLAY